MSEKDKSFAAFLKAIGHSFKTHPTELGYFGEILLWSIVGGVISWLVFPQTWVPHPTDLSGLSIFIPFLGFGILRGIYHLWKSEEGV